jgi:hypothetical protein
MAGVISAARGFGHTPTHVVSDARCFSIKSTMQCVVVGSRLSKAVRLLGVLQLFLVIAVFMMDFLIGQLAVCLQGFSE